MKVIKFGGSSVGSVKNLHRVSQIIQQQNQPFIMVVSAFSGVTNQLQELGEKALKNDYEIHLTKLKERHVSTVKELIDINKQTNVLIDIQQTFLELEQICKSVFALGELSDKTKARILSKGELLSSQIIYQFLKQQNIEINYLKSSGCIKANGDFLNAKINFKKTYSLCKEQISTLKNYIVPGFIASNESNQITVLGRGGSDYTASVFACAINAEKIELWSDVNGMQNANPKLVKKTQVIRKMSYEEAFEMSYFGAKVVYPPAIKPAMQKKIPVWLKNTLQPQDKGTLIHVNSNDENNKVLGVSTLSDISMITVSGTGLSGKRGSARKVFQALEYADVNIILITQSCSEQSICFAINNNDTDTAKKALEKQFEHEIQSHQINPIDVSKNHVIIALIGDQMRHQVGLSGKTFSALGKNNINVKAIAQGASERNISVVIDAKDEDKAVNVIHERFFQNTIKKIHLFIAGVGNVGKQFIDILKEQKSYCKEHFKVDLKIVAVANSSHFLINNEGISFNEIENVKSNGKSYSSFNEFVEIVKNSNLRNSIVIDNTASDEVSKSYATFFKNSISVVTCNKIASSSDFKNYSTLKLLTKKHSCNFQYETSVGAALPIIKTIQNLNLSGDKIHRIDAVVSGSLNFIFNNYTKETRFVDIVKQAQKEGYTEPDPRIDLSGLDVIRKILILSREAGYEKNIKDVSFSSFLPDECMKTNSVEDFYQSLEKNEAFFKKVLEKATQNNAKLKVVAQLIDGNLKVGLQEVSINSPFYQLDGKDNIVAVYTQLYNPEPLIVKGAGAGARITASGVFADLMYIVNQK